MSGVRPDWRTVSADIAVFGIAFGFTNVISYLYLVIAGRTLAGSDFGVFNALLGLITLCGFLANSVQLAVTQAAAQNASRSELAVLMRTTLQSALPSTTLLVLAAMPFAAVIGANPEQVVLCGVVVLLMFLGSTALGFLAGIGRIRIQAGINLVGAMVRLATGWLLLLVGVGTVGAILGYLFNYAAVLLVAGWVGSRVVARRSFERTSEPKLRLDVSTPATFVFAFGPFTLDQLLVQALAPSLGGIMPPCHHGKARLLCGLPGHGRNLSPHVAEIRAATSGAAACGNGGRSHLYCRRSRLDPGHVSGANGGHALRDRFPEAVPYVGSLAFGIACFSISAVAAHALIVWGSRLGFVPSMVALGVGMILFVVRHDSLATLVENQVWVYGLQLVLLWGLLGMTIRRSLTTTSPAVPEGVAT